MSVGAFVVLGIVHTAALRKAGEKQANALSNRALLGIGPVLVLAVLASFFHLGNPTNAYRAINNIDSSWLSREILLTVLFVGVGGVFALMQLLQIGQFRVRQAIAVVAALGWFALASLALLGIELVVIPLYISTLATAGPTGVDSVSVIIDKYGTVFALRLVLGFIGAGLFGVFLYRSAVLNRQTVMITA